MSLFLYIMGISLLLWLVLAKKILTWLSTRYFISEDEITVAYTKYDRNRHRPTNWLGLSIIHFFSLISLSFFVSIVMSIGFGIGIGFTYIFFGNLFISLPIMFFSTYLGAAARTSSPLQLIPWKKYTHAPFSTYLIIFAFFSIITFTLILFEFIPSSEPVVASNSFGLRLVEVVMGFTILFLILEGWSQKKESSISKIGIILLIGALGCGMLVFSFPEYIIKPISEDHIVLASILLLMIAYTELSSITQRRSFLILSSGTVIFLFVILISFAFTDIFPIQPITNLSDIKDVFGPQNTIQQNSYIRQSLIYLPMVMIPSVASGFLAIFSWQSTSKQIENDVDISRISYLSMFLILAVQLLILAFAFSIRKTTHTLVPHLLVEDFIKVVFGTQQNVLRLVYIAIICMALLIVAPAFRLADVALESLITNRIVKWSLFIGICSGVFIYLPQFSENVLHFLVLFGSASMGVSAIYMTLARVYLKSEELETRLLSLIVVILSFASLTGYMLVVAEILTGWTNSIDPGQILTLILAIIAASIEFILLIIIQLKGVESPIIDNSHEDVESE